ncbi:SCO3870 family protein [Streptomyces muensis]
MPAAVPTPGRPSFVAAAYVESVATFSVLMYVTAAWLW